MDSNNKSNVKLEGEDNYVISRIYAGIKPKPYSEVYNTTSNSNKKED